MKCDSESYIDIDLVNESRETAHEKYKSMGFSLEDKFKGFTAPLINRLVRLYRHFG